MPIYVFAHGESIGTIGNVVGKAELVENPIRFLELCHLWTKYASSDPKNQPIYVFAHGESIGAIDNVVGKAEQVEIPIRF